MQQLGVLIRCVQCHPHQLVEAIDFPDADPALPHGQIEHAIGELPFPAETLGCSWGGAAVGLRQAPVLTPEAAASIQTSSSWSFCTAAVSTPPP